MKRVDAVEALTIYTATAHPSVVVIARAGADRGGVALPLGFDDVNGTPPSTAQRVIRYFEQFGKQILVGKSIGEQRQIDQATRDATQGIEDSSIRAKLRFLLSFAFARLSASVSRQPFWEYLSAQAGLDAPQSLPTPLITLVSGGKVATSDLHVQSIMIIPSGPPTVRERIRAGAEITHAFSSLLSDQAIPYALGDEGGYSAHFPGDSGLEMVQNVLRTAEVAIRNAGYDPTSDVRFALDFAASYWRVGHSAYDLIREGEALQAHEVADFCVTLCGQHSIVMIEDPLDVVDVSALDELRDRLNGDVAICGDDLGKYPEVHSRLDALVVMPDRIGTVMEIIQTVESLRNSGTTVVGSARSSETEDVTISDLSAALRLDYIKAGGIQRSDRTAKYNQLMRIEEQLTAHSI